MHALKKINLTCYFILSLISLFGLSYFFGNLAYFLEVCTVMVLIVANHLLLLASLAPVFDINREKKPSALLLGSMFLVKFIVLAGTFYYITTYLRERVIFYLVLYIFQLIILFISIKRDVNQNEGR